MPSATLDARALQSTNPIKRAMDVLCVIILQLLTLMAVCERDPARLRNHPALGAQSILSRLEAGDTFDLPLLLMAPIRAVISRLRAELRLDEVSLAQLCTPILTEPQNPPAQAKAAPRRSTKRHAPPPKPRRAPPARQTPTPARRAAIPGLSKEKALGHSVYPRPIRYDNATYEPRQTGPTSLERHALPPYT